MQDDDGPTYDADEDSRRSYFHAIEAKREALMKALSNDENNDARKLEAALNRGTG